MTYIQPLEISSAQSQGTLGAPASIAANERMPCGPITHSGITVNAQGQLVLSANQTHIIMGAAYIESNSGTGTIEVQWYDVTNSAWLGRSQESWVSTISNSYPRTSVARCVVVPSVSTTIEFRVVSVGPISRINVNSLASGYGGRAWYGAISF
jgi:hypothetical protein